MKMDRILIYPYDLQSCPIVRHKELLKEYEVAALVSPRGWGMNGKDGRAADNGSEIGITISCDFEESLNLCDTVLICESTQNPDFESVILPKVFRAVEVRKNIIFTKSLERKYFESILKKCTDNGVYFKLFGLLKEEPDFPEIPVENEIIHKINTPVIFVMGTGERTNKFELQLSLRENIGNMGYKISQIGTRGYCELLGFHSFPSFMYSRKISESNKIVLFNHFVKSIEMEEQPDLIIIGIPGGIMSFSNNLTNRFGVLAYEVSQAVIPDSTVFSCHCDGYRKDFFIKLKDSVRHKFGCTIDCFNIANVVLDLDSSKERNRTIYLSLQSKHVDEAVENFIPYGQSFYNVLNAMDALKMSEYLVDMLAEYGKTHCI